MTDRFADYTRHDQLVNSARYRLFEIGPFIPSSYSNVVEAHSLSERMSRYVHSETFHVELQESQNAMIELVNSWVSYFDFPSLLSLQNGLPESTSFFRIF